MAGDRCPSKASAAQRGGRSRSARAERGAAVQTPLDGRVIAVGLPQLRAARHVIGFAHGPRRATALRAAAASGAFSSVIVDSTLASAMLGSEQSVSGSTGENGRSGDVTNGL
jgi:hypothetical protein